MAEQDARGGLALTSQGFGNMPVLNQVGFLMGIAASIAIGGAVAFWAQTPNYHNLYSGLAAKDVMAVTDALQKIGVPFEMSGTGTIRVPGDQVDQVKIKLAAEGCQIAREKDLNCWIKTRVLVPVNLWKRHATNEP